MRYKVGDKVRVRINLVPNVRYGRLTFLDGHMSKCAGQICTIMEVLSGEKYYVSENPFAWSEEMLEPADNTLEEITLITSNTVRGENHFCNGFRGGKIPTPEKPVSIEEQLGLPKGVSIHDLPTTELIKKEFNVAWIDKIALPTATETKEMVERVRREILKFTNAFPKEDKSMKYTFCVVDVKEIDKTCNKEVATKVTYAWGANTYEAAETSCPTDEYDQYTGALVAAAKITAKKSDTAKMLYNIARDNWGSDLSKSILFELANNAFNGNFERAYKKFLSIDKQNHDKLCKCRICGCSYHEDKITGERTPFTPEEARKCEEAHIERKKQKRENYLIRKEAKRRIAEAEREKKVEQAMRELGKK